MVAATECKYEGNVIDIDSALILRNRAGKKTLSFICKECGEPVRAHKAGGRMKAHFEHLERNPFCSLSDSTKRKKHHETTQPIYELDDLAAIEGYEIDLDTTFLYRNRNIALECKKRDDFTCQACGFRLSHNGKFVIECHHIFPVADSGVREVSLNDLVSLCPTCHRIAHTRKIPFSVEEIKSIINGNSV
ncbi:HNH endonuclease [Paraneptunicella aestuarii]|uniref:HNH endonuclease n=1 Tax=Paraneptunicella aestuarii TaxID=2831148 RepID=UPI001E45F9CD|nr:HNH endonuclease [Paraneptunicella aestuarii]UAA37451.1 HNH endonuclease [Paraneptunicella aestuarii]